MCNKTHRLTKRNVQYSYMINHYNQLNSMIAIKQTVVADKTKQSLFYTKDETEQLL